MRMRQLGTLSWESSAAGAVSLSLRAGTLKGSLQCWDPSCSSNKLTLHMLAENLQTSLHSSYLLLLLYILLIQGLNELFYSLCNYYISCFNIKEHAFLKGSYYFKGMKLKPEEIAWMQCTICLASSYGRLYETQFAQEDELDVNGWQWHLEETVWQIKKHESLLWPVKYWIKYE